MNGRMPVRRAVARAALRLARWRTVGEVPRSGIIVGAPHTSNWDWVAMLVLLWSRDVRPRVLIKQELFRGPLGWVLRSTGGVPVDRAAPGAVVERLADQARDDESFLVVLAAEGTRSKGSFWKSGFYRIAQQTGLPITLAFIDTPSRTVGWGPTFHPTGDVTADMDLIRDFYADKTGFRPENCSSASSQTAYSSEVRSGRVAMRQRPRHSRPSCTAKTTLVLPTSAASSMAVPFSPRGSSKHHIAGMDRPGGAVFQA